jgi:hypothetical protein
LELLGAVALAVHRAPRATTDIDPLIWRKSLEAAAEVARRLGFVLEALPMRFPDGMEIRRLSKIVDEETLTLDLLVIAYLSVRSGRACRSPFQLSQSLCQEEIHQALRAHPAQTSELPDARQQVTVHGDQIVPLCVVGDFEFRGFRLIPILRQAVRVPELGHFLIARGFRNRVLAQGSLLFSQMISTNRSKTSPRGR